MLWKAYIFAFCFLFYLYSVLIDMETLPSK